MCNEILPTGKHLVGILLHRRATASMNNSSDDPRLFVPERFDRIEVSSLVGRI